MRDPGRLRYRFALETPVDVEDGAGGFERCYNPIGSFWADMVPASFNEDVDDQARASRATHRLRARALKQLTIDHRLRLGADRLFRILAIRDEFPGLINILVEELRR